MRYKVKVLGMGVSWLDGMRCEGEKRAVGREERGDMRYEVEPW